MTETGEARHVIEARREKLRRLAELGIEPFAYKYEPNCSAESAIGDFVAMGEETTVGCRLAGRVRSLRPHGKTTFAHLEDRTGKIQVYFRKDVLGEARYELIQLLDLGDWIGVSGSVFKTKTGEVTLKADEVELLAKTVRPLPYGKEEESESGEIVVHSGFNDVEGRYRQRYADLAVHPDVRELFVMRSRAVQEIGRFLEDRGFLNVETPILQPIYGGAMAQPFKTYHRALETDLYLRIADELYLKRLVVGGLERVYEIGKVFRNEGIDRTHNPEFTMLELYQAYADGRAALLDGLFKILVEDHLIGPVIIYDYPVELSPLAKHKRGGDTALTERFEVFVGGHELANAFSELNDPFEQRERFESQVRMRDEEGWEDAHQIDDDYLAALEYGLPPTGGMGMGIDRLVMILTDRASIREVILFPTLRPE
jgi:lysyl-tRNA synthetase class 2